MNSVASYNDGITSKNKSLHRSMFRNSHSAKVLSDGPCHYDLLTMYRNSIEIYEYRSRDVFVHMLAPS